MGAAAVYRRNTVMLVDCSVTVELMQGNIAVNARDRVNSVIPALCAGDRSGRLFQMLEICAS